MNVDVGVDVHRKRSQIAIVDAAGVQQRNRSLATARLKNDKVDAATLTQGRAG